MHHNDVVVSITDSKDKNYREYDFSQNKSYPTTKKSTVILPFDSEYKVRIHNKGKWSRILVKIDIDGTNVSGNGIIIPANTKANIERFMDIPKKFKFVPSDSDGVGDPDSPDNGNITIHIHREKEDVTFDSYEHKIGGSGKFYPDDNTWNDNYDKCLRPQTGDSTLDTMFGSLKDENSSGQVPEVPSSGGVNYSCDSIQTRSLNNMPKGVTRRRNGSGSEEKGSTLSFMSQPTSHQVEMSRGCTNISTQGAAGQMFDNLKDMRQSNLKAADLGELGATVEGSNSEQTFGKSEWQGNAESLGFTFNFSLKGRSETAGMGAEESAEFEEYKRLQSKFG